MPPVTRSCERLSVADGLAFIDQSVIDLATDFHAELRATSATYGEETIEKIIPHVARLMDKLNDMAKMNSDLNEEVLLLRAEITSADVRCSDLNRSFRDKSLQCYELEDLHDAEICRLTTQLKEQKTEIARLRENTNDNLDVQRMIQESEEKVAVLTVERKRLITSLEVLEADVKCLRSELRRAESLARRRRSSVDLGESLLAELTAAGDQQTTSSDEREPVSVAQQSTSTQNPASDMDLSPPLSDTSTLQSPFKDVLLIGDSHLRYASTQCVASGASLECCPGGKIVDIKSRLLRYLDVSFSVIYIHVGCNNLKRGYRGGPGYNGGYGKREVLHDMADLLFTARTKFPRANIILNSVLVRRDVGYRPLYDFNSQLESMCNNFGVTFVEANCCVGRRDLTRDGVHFSRKGVSRLSSMLVEVVSEIMKTAPTLPSVVDEANTPLPPGPTPAQQAQTSNEFVVRHSTPRPDSGN